MDTKDMNLHSCKQNKKNIESNEDIFGRFALKPILVFMAVSGCFTFRGRTRINVLLWIYKIVYLLVVLTLVVRLCYYFYLAVISNLVTISLCLQCLGNFVFSWKTFSTRYGHFYSTLEKWIQRLNEMDTKGIRWNPQSLLKLQIISVILSVILQLICISAQFISMYLLMASPDELKQIGYDILTAPLEDSYTARLALTIPFSLMMMTLITPVTFLIMISNMIIVSLQSFNKYLKTMKRKRNLAADKLGPLRNIHLDLCTAISKFDKDFGLLYANICFWTIAMGLLLLYSLVKFQHTFLGVAVHCTYLTLSLILLVCTSVSAAFVHEKAHDPLSMLYFIDVSNLSQEATTQLHLFISKLTGTQIGFSVCGLLTITKEFILTIAGVFLTYFAVLYTL